MLDPGSGYNKSQSQEWSDIFWKRTMKIWLPFLILFQLIREKYQAKQEKK